MYPILIKCLKVSKGSFLVRRHGHGKYKSQTILYEIKRHFQGLASRAARIHRNQIWDQIQADRMALDSNKPYADQLVDWQIRIIMYNDMASKSEMIGPDMELQFMKKYVCNVKEMDDAALFVEMGHDQEVVSSAEEAMLLYEFRARILDDKRRQLLMQRSKHRELKQMLHVQNLTDTHIANLCDAYDVDYHNIIEDDNELLVHYGSIKERMSGARHRLISRDGRIIWDRLSDDDKNAIMGFVDRIPPRRNGSRGNGRYNGNNRGAPSSRTGTVTPISQPLRRMMTIAVSTKMIPKMIPNAPTH
jgi:hypothetical protein